VEDFLDYILTNLGRMVDYRRPGTLSHAERLVVSQAQCYAIAKAKERKHRRETPDNCMTDDEWDEALDDALKPYA
jgi:hypothetical protein